MFSPRIFLLLSVAMLLALQNSRHSHGQENTSPICNNQSLFTMRPDPIQYVVPGQNHCVECRHQSFNSTDWTLGNFAALCNLDTDVTCNINDSGMLCFEPVKLENINPVGFKCLFNKTVDTKSILCSADFNLTRGTVPVINDSSLTHALDFDSGPLTLSPTFSPGVPPASLKWFHNGQPIPGAVSSTLVIGSGSNGNIDGADRGVYEARAVGGVQEVSLTYTITVRFFIPEVTLTTEPAVLTPGFTSQFKVICTVVSNPELVGIQWSMTPYMPVTILTRLPNMIELDYQVVSKVDVMGCPNVIFTCQATSGQSVKSSPLEVCKPVMPPPPSPSTTTITATPSQPTTSTATPSQSTAATTPITGSPGGLRTGAIAGIVNIIVIVIILVVNIIIIIVLHVNQCRNKVYLSKRKDSNDIALKTISAAPNDAYGVLGGGVLHSIEVESNTAYSTVKAPSQSIAVDTNDLQYYNEKSEDHYYI